MKRKMFITFIFIFLMFISSIKVVYAQTGLVGYWKFDEGSGSFAADSSGNGNTGTLMNKPIWTTDCISGKCLAFGGVNDYVSINKFGDFSNGFTITMWLSMKPNVNAQRPFLSGFFSTCYVDTGSTSMTCFLGNGTSYSSSLTTSGWSYNSWTHFALTYDKTTGNWVIYRNGTSVGTSTYNYVMSMTNTFCIGANCWNGGSQDNFNGTIDEVKIYNGALTASEVYADYTGMLVPTQFSISGQLKNDTNNIQANISAYNQGTSTINGSQITSNGLYNISIWSGVYDVQYNILNLFIPNFYIRLPSLNIASNLADVVSYVNQYPSQNKLSFTFDNSTSKTVQTFSGTEPSRVLINGTSATEVSSLSQLVGYTWFYSSAESKLYLNTTFVPPTCSDGTVYGFCSATKPKYCNSGTLVDNCLQCGCPSVQACNSSTNQCYTSSSNVTADYYVLGSSGSYIAKNSSGSIIATGSNATTVISTVLNIMKAGQRVAFSSDFTIDSTITVNVANITMDFSQATVTVTSSVTAFRDNGGSNTFYGGGTYDFANDVYTSKSVWTGVNGASAILVWSPSSTIDGFEFKEFVNSVLGVAEPASGSSYVTIKNCYYHDNTGSTQINLIGGSYNQILYNKLVGGTGGATSWTLIMDNGGGDHNTIEYNDLSGAFGSGAHCIYSDKGGHPGGYNEVAYNRFHDVTGGAGYQIKTYYNKVHDNTFTNFSNTAPPFSIYSELNGYTANDNEIYNNTFTNCYYGLWIGRGASPTLRNLVHNNTFTNIQHVFRLGSDIDTYCEDSTKIYYNNFHNCGTFLDYWLGFQWSKDLNTVFAYNYFDAAVSGGDVSIIQNNMTNSMIYQNTFFPPNTNLAMANFNYSNITDPSSWYYVAPRT